MRRADLRRYWMNTNYLCELLLASFGCLWLIVWIVSKAF